MYCYSFTVDILSNDDVQQKISVLEFSETEQKELKIIILNEINDMVEMGRSEDEGDRRSLFEMMNDPTYSIDDDHEICITYCIPDDKIKLIQMEVSDGYLSVPVDIMFSNRDLLITIS
jgi:hypothetical protein